MLSGFEIFQFFVSDHVKKVRLQLGVLRYSAANFQRAKQFNFSFLCLPEISKFRVQFKHRPF